jgi:hypothetical protein
MRCRLVGSVALVALALSGSVGAASDRHDRHAGYYYPLPSTSETYVSKAARLADTDRTRRILFVTEITQRMLDNPYPPQVAIFAKGGEGEKLIVTSLYDGAYDTTYRMRGLLAMLTAWARQTPIFRAYEVEDLFNFLDLLKLLGFERVTLTDGDNYAHRIDLE